MPWSRRIEHRRLSGNSAAPCRSLEILATEESGEDLFRFFEPGGNLLRIYTKENERRNLSMLELLLFPFKALTFLVLLPFRILAFVVFFPLKILAFLLCLFLLILLVPVAALLFPLILVALSVLLVIGLCKFALG